MLEGKKIVVGVCGGIAAYKMPDVASGLRKLGAEVKVILTQSGAQFVTPLALQTVSKNPVISDMFDEPKAWEVQHISLAEWADLFFVAPATANIIGKLAGGIADDMLSTTIMATRAPVLLAPAMNTNMYHNPIVQENIGRLTRLGYQFVPPESGMLACGAVGDGRLPGKAALLEAVQRVLTQPKDLAGLRVLVTAGPTREPFDPVRFITNHSSGKMGYALARAAAWRGAEVTLVSGPVSLETPAGVERVDVSSAQDMADAVLQRFPTCDVLIMAAAVGDYRPETAAENKIKKAGDMTVRLTRNPDILAAIADMRREDQCVIGFCMETQDLRANAEDKLRRKRLDYIVANDLREPDAGFGGDNNTVMILSADGGCEQLPNMSKLDAANRILDKVRRK